MFLTLPADRLTERILRCVLGLALFGLGIAMFITSKLGVAPWDVFHQGFGRKVGIPTGIVIEITGVVILLLWIPLKEKMGLGTLINAVEIGLVVWAIGDHLPHSDRLVPRLAYLAGGLMCIGIGTGLYIGAGLGSGPRDGLMLGLSKRGISVRVARTGIELAALAAGLAMGGTIGVGTLVFTFGIGPLVHVIMPRTRLKGDTIVLANAH